MRWFFLCLTIIIVWTIAALLGLSANELPKWKDHFRQRLAIWYEKPKDPVRLAAYGALCLSVLFGGLGYFDLLPLSQKLIDDFYANVAAELASIAITILVIDRLVEWRAEQSYKQQILEQLRSNVNVAAVEAVRISRRRGWLENGTLRHLDLSLADLSGALMFSANLEGVKFIGTNLNGVSLGNANMRNAYLSDAQIENGRFLNADLYGVDFENANLKKADLRNAILIQANFCDADLSEADLRGANLTGAELSLAIMDGVVYDSSTIWPEGFDPAVCGAILVEDD